MRKKLCLFFLFIAVTIGVCPVFTQDSGALTNTLDLGLASDEEITQALDKADDIELVNKEDSLPAGTSLAEEMPASAGKETAGTSGGNAYLQESRRLVKLAQEAFSSGDYDASVRFADEAVRSAKQSDVYVAITVAKRYIDQTVVSGISARFPVEYREAENWYNQSTKARDSEEWDAAIDAAGMAAQLLKGLAASGSHIPASAPLPATYTVRSWSVSKDCLWNIAGQPWAYGNPRQWTALYNANKSKLPDPNDPNRLEPGIVLDIPSIQGEIRQGAWESGKTYDLFK